MSARLFDIEVHELDNGEIEATLFNSEGEGLITATESTPGEAISALARWADLYR